MHRVNVCSAPASQALRWLRAVLLGGVTVLTGTVAAVLLIGFVAGVFVAELASRHDARRAWASTVHALKGVALSAGVEFTGALLAAITWTVAVVF